MHKTIWEKKQGRNHEEITLYDDNELEVCFENTAPYEGYSASLYIDADKLIGLIKEAQAKLTPEGE